jgi:AcrR family transcriptional regulator
VRHVDTETPIALSFHLVPVSAGSPQVTVLDRPSARVRHLGADDRSSQRVRVVDATLACLADQGFAKTTLDDIASRAGLSRATIYRAFPGGREAILAATVDTEVARMFSDLAVAMGEAHDLEEVLVVGIVETARHLEDHRALRFLLEHECEVLLPHLCFDSMNRVLAVASSFAAPFLGRWLEPEQSIRAAEWATRIAFSYVFELSGRIDATSRQDVERLVSRFVLPGVLALRSSPPNEPTRPQHRHDLSPPPTNGAANGDRD